MGARLGPLGVRLKGEGRPGEQEQLEKGSCRHGPGPLGAGLNDEDRALQDPGLLSPACLVSPTLVFVVWTFV